MSEKKPSDTTSNKARELPDEDALRKMWEDSHHLSGLDSFIDGYQRAHQAQAAREAALSAEVNQLTYELGKSRDSHGKIIERQEKELAALRDHGSSEREGLFIRLRKEAEAEVKKLRGENEKFRKGHSLYKNEIDKFKNIIDDMQTELAEQETLLRESLHDLNQWQSTVQPEDKSQVTEYLIHKITAHLEKMS